MFDIAWTEMALVAAIMLLVIGPKELPRVLRQMGIWVRKLRTLAGEFQKNLDDMVRESELDDVRKDVERIGRMNPMREAEKAIDPTGEVDRALRLDDEDKPQLAKIPTASQPAEAPEPTVPQVPQEQPKGEAEPAARNEQGPKP